MASAQPGTFEESFITAPLPAITPGAANRKTCQNGKFHGITARTTPSGWKTIKLLRFGLDRFQCEKALGVVGVEVAGERAFLALGDAVADRLSHFLRHQLGVFAGVVPQHLRRLMHQAGAARKVHPPPREKRIMRLADSVSNAVIRHL